jgi:dihydrolipoamide dehydrogenase
MQTYDIAVIGGGPGGYVAAIRSAQLGFSVVLIEKSKTLGGTCLNVGCIPSKALLESTELLHQANEKFSVHGIQTGAVSVDFAQMMKRKTDVVISTTKGIDYLIQKNKITRLLGTGTLIAPGKIQVQSDTETSEITAKKIILATGSEPTPLPSAPFDFKRVISSTEALALTEIPKSMAIIGAGVIGVEMGSIYARLGTEVTMVEFMDAIIPTMDKELGRALERSLKKLKITFQLGTKVTGVNASKKSVTVSAETKSGSITLEAEYVLVAIGRRPYTAGLGLENVGLAADERGRIPINDHFETAVPGIYAIGDAVRGSMLAHKASEEGAAVAEIIAGQHAHIDYNCIPGVVYTWPEVASVGQTEEELKTAGITYKKGVAPFKASGRARAAEESDGFIKILADTQTDEILGVHMIGPRCADLIGEAVVAMSYRASAEDIGIISHAHPTFSESIKEAALAATDNRAIHF